MTDTQTPAEIDLDDPADPEQPRWIEYVNVDDVPPAHKNAKAHDLDAIRASIIEFGFTTPGLIDERTGRLVAGHGRIEAVALHRDAGGSAPGGITVVDDEWQVPVTRGWSSENDAQANAYAIADNRLNEIGGWHDITLAELLDDVASDSVALLNTTGYTEADLDALIEEAGGRDALHRDDEDDDTDDEGDGSSSWDDPDATAEETARAEDDDAPRPTLADRFLIPPFDVLDARSGWWQARKKRWLSLGIKSELGRDARQANRDGDRQPYTREEEKGLLLGSASGRDPTYYAQKTRAEKKVGRTLTLEEFEAEHYDPSAQYESGTSIFDPVLCELVYRWFSRAGMTVLDPFAGGSVRGLMAALLGRRYAGNDLAADQITANRAQHADFVSRGLVAEDDITWTVGDSADWVTTLAPETADLLLTCPPYLWLERYSDGPADLSGMSQSAFEEVYTRILAGCARALRDNRYAVIVVGDVREPRTGQLVDFRGMTIRAAQAAGLRLLSGGVMVTPVGSLAVRAPRSFLATRALGRTHQDVLLFWKGDRSAAAKELGDVDVSVPESMLEEAETDAEQDGAGEPASSQED